MRMVTPEVNEAITDVVRRFGAGIDAVTHPTPPPHPGQGAAGRLAQGEWQVASPAAGLVRRHVELCLPASAESAHSARRAGADVWVADFEDSMSPTWDNLVAGYAAVAEYARSYTPDQPTLMIRPRPLGVEEDAVVVDGRPAPAAIVDVVMFFHHCARPLTERGVGPYVYLPKLNSTHQAWWWNRVLSHLEDSYGIPRGSARAAILVETIQAGQEMEGMLYQLRHHAGGLTVGRWDYLLSALVAENSQQVTLPQRTDITPTTPMVKALSQRVVDIAHRRGTHAIGTLSGYTTTTGEQPTRVLGRVRAEKVHEARIGLDGSWAGCPSVVDAVRTGFQDVIGDAPHQLSRMPRSHGGIDPPDLGDLASFNTVPTMAGVRMNVAVTLRYLAAWLAGRGQVVIDSMVTDASAAEISWAQLHHWVRSQVVLAEGIPVTTELINRLLTQELASAPHSCAGEAGEILRSVLTNDRWVGLLSYAYTTHLRAPAYA